MRGRDERKIETKEREKKGTEKRAKEYNVFWFVTKERKEINTQLDDTRISSKANLLRVPRRDVNGCHPKIFRERKPRRTRDDGKRGERRTVARTVVGNVQQTRVKGPDGGEGRKDKQARGTTTAPFIPMYTHKYAVFVEERGGRGGEGGERDFG